MIGYRRFGPTETSLLGLGSLKALNEGPRGVGK